MLAGYKQTRLLWAMDPSTWTNPAVCPQQGVVRWSIPGILRETGHYEITHYFRLEEGVPGVWGENNQVQDPELKFHRVVREGGSPNFQSSVHFPFFGPHNGLSACCQIPCWL